jgi:hypothetical protein
MTGITDGSLETPAEKPVSWAEKNVPTILRPLRWLRRLPPLPKPLALFLTAVLGILGLLAFITLIAFTVNITMRP